MPDTASNNLYNALQRLNRQMHRHRHRTMPPREGLHRGQIHLLFLISQNDGVIQRDLADIMDMRPSSITEMLTNLEQGSLIARKQDEKDRRVTHVYLTEAGKTAVNGFTQDNDKLSGSLFSCLTDDEIESMLKIVNKINTNLEAMDDTGAVESCERKRCHNGYRRHHHHWDEE